MPDSAECTTTGRSPSARRSRSTEAMFFQLATEDTLVPPNFSTTHGEAAGVVSALVIASTEIREGKNRPRRAAPASLSGRLGRLRRRHLNSSVFEVVQLFFQTALRQHVFQLAPGSAALLHGIGCRLRPTASAGGLQKPVVI